MEPSDLFKSLVPVPMEKFGGLFSSFKKTAFRLELLPLYTVPDERDVFLSYLAGKAEPPANFCAEWRDLIRASREVGKQFQRVRLIRSNVSDYIKFEIKWAYIGNIEAGEEIRIIRDDREYPFAANTTIYKDFWLFDQSDCYIMEYDLIGQFLGLNRVPIQYVKPYVELASEAMAISKPLEQCIPI